MEMFDRLARLRRVVVVGEVEGVINGQKKLQKLVYLCQKAGGSLGYSYGFHFYGVYSAELARDVAMAAHFGILTEHPVQNSNPGQDSYKISLGEKDLPDSASAAVLPDNAVSLLRLLRNESVTVLEVLSTIVYLRECGYEADAFTKKLSALKGHLERSFDRAFDLEEQMPGSKVGVALSR